MRRASPGCEGTVGGVARGQERPLAVGVASSGARPGVGPVRAGVLRAGPGSYRSRGRPGGDPQSAAPGARRPSLLYRSAAEERRASGEGSAAPRWDEGPPGEGAAPGERKASGGGLRTGGGGRRTRWPRRPGGTLAGRRNGLVEEAIDLLRRPLLQRRHLLGAQPAVGGLLRRCAGWRRPSSPGPRPPGQRCAPGRRPPGFPGQLLPQLVDANSELLGGDVESETHRRATANAGPAGAGRVRGMRPGRPGRPGARPAPGWGSRPRRAPRRWPAARRSGVTPRRPASASRKRCMTTPPGRRGVVPGVPCGAGVAVAGTCRAVRSRWPARRCWWPWPPAKGWPSARPRPRKRAAQDEGGAPPPGCGREARSGWCHTLSLLC